MAEDSLLFATAHPAPELADSPPYNWESYAEDFIVFESDSDSDGSEKDDEAAEMDVDTVDSSFDTTETYDDAFKASPESPRVKCLRWDKGSGLVPPYCATAPAYFARKPSPSNVELGGSLQVPGPSPLRNIALSNVPEWSLTGALERSPSCPLAPPGPDYPDVGYGADGGLFHDDTIDQVRMPTSLVELVRRDYFDGQDPAQHGFRASANRQEWLRSQWARMSAGTGRIQVVRYRRSPSASSPQKSQHCPRSSSGDGAAKGRKNWFRNNHCSQPSRTLFTTSVEFEAEDNPGLDDEDSKEARMAEAAERIKNRRSELEQKSWQHALPHRKHCEYHIEPDEFMDRLQARSEYQRGMDKLHESRQGWPIAEPMLDGVLCWQCNTDPVKSSPEDLSGEYAAALKLWPSKSSEKVKEKRIERRYSLGEKRKVTELSEFAWTLKEVETDRTCA